MGFDNESLRLVTQIFIVLAALAATAFPALYSRSPWKDSAVGRSLMFQSSALALMLWMNVIFRYWFRGDFPALWVTVVRCFVFSMIFITSIYFTCVLWRLNHTSREESHR